MEIKQIRENLYSIEEGMVRCFLVLGKTEALLIDTGIKKGLKKKIEEITNLPIKVILTHGDSDHTTAKDEFTEVYAHPIEIEFKNLKEVLPLTKDIIEIGEFKLEIILIPGHTPGSIALLEKTQRFLISGDSVSEATIYMFGKGRNIFAWRDSLHILAKYKNDFDVIYASHGPVAIAPDQIDACLSLINETLSGEIPGMKAPDNFDALVKVYQSKDKRASMYYIAD